MGTRHYIGVISDKETKVAQYGQWDGYPEGQGATVLNFLREANLETFKSKLNNCRFIEDRNEIRQMYVSVGDDPNNNFGFISHEIAEKFNEKWPSLSRDTGGKILELIYNSETEVLLQNSENFLDDSVFCEFAYVIDLDKNTLTCFCSGKNIFARYYLDNLPTNEKLGKDYEEYSKKNY